MFYYKAMELNFVDVLVVLLIISYFFIAKYVAFFSVLFLFLKIAERGIKKIGKK